MKLLLAAPCNWVSNDPEMGPSLIGVFHDIAVKVVAESEIPSNAVLPKEWAIYCKWELLPEEFGYQYFVVSEIYWPDGTLLSQSKIKSVVPAVNALAFILRNQGFPFGQSGKVKIRLWIEREHDGEIQIVYEPIELFISVRIDKDLVPR